MTTHQEIRIIPFQTLDLGDIMQIEPRIFTIPWSRRSYEELISLDTVRMYVAKRDRELVGYMLFQCWGDEMELHTIGVKPECQGCGIGRSLIAELLGEARALKVKRIFLQVRPSNSPARALYAKFGFVAIGLRRNYYRDDGEDALVMKWEVDEEDVDDQ